MIRSTRKHLEKPLNLLFKLLPKKVLMDSKKYKIQIDTATELSAQIGKLKKNLQLIKYWEY